jgi:hypothetical protein
MFNQLTPADIVTAVGTTLRAAARSEDRTSDFERDQLLSAYSATRHLAVELSSFTPVLEGYAAAVAERVRAAEVEDEGLGTDLTAIAERLEADDITPAAAGDAVGDLLARLHDAPSAGGDLLRDVRALTRRLADDEVDLLAEALG